MYINALLQIFLGKITFFIYIILYFSDIKYNNNIIFITFAKVVYNIIYNI